MTENEGVPCNEIEDRINKKENENTLKLKKGVQYLILNSTSNVCLVKALNSWKEYYFERKSMKMGINKMCKLLG